MKAQKRVAAKGFRLPEGQVGIAQRFSACHYRRLGAGDVKPRRGGLFIESPATLSPVFLFSAAPLIPDSMRVKGRGLLNGRGRRKQKKDEEGEATRYYKQATPTGFTPASPDRK